MQPDLNYRHLHYFRVAAKAGRVTSAAKELGLSQSALSIQLKKLEASLGHALFNRARAGLELTQQGRMVLEHCERIFAEGAALSEALRGTPGTTPIRLGVSAVLGREAALTFIEGLAGLDNAAVTVYVGPGEDLRDRLAQGRLDIAVSATDLTGRLGPGYEARRIETLPINFMASPAVARSLPGFPGRGQKVPMLLRTRDYAPRVEVERFLRERGVRASIVAESEDADLLQTLARRGRGVVALHRAAARADLGSGALVRIGPAQTGLHHEIWVVTPAPGSVDPIVRRAIALARRA